jgi:hypothetical protein
MGERALGVSMNEQEYRAAPGVNWSTLKHMGRSPLHYRHAVTSPSTEPTPAMILGTAVHLLTLQPERASEIVAFEGDKRTKEWKQFKADNAAKLILGAEDLATARAMAAAVRAHPVAGPLLAGCQTEIPIFYVDAATGLTCKVRLDAAKPGAVVDLKSARDVAPRAFGRQSAALDYPGQLAHYGAGWEAETGDIPSLYIVAVENTAPYDVAVYELDHVATHAALARRRRYLDRVAECVASGIWPGQVPELAPLDVPTYYMEDSEDV